jgi:rhodanese-related sulfurtransferase
MTSPAAPFEVSVDELAALGTPGADYDLIDVREVDEVARLAVEGAVNIPLTEFTGRLDELPDGRVYVMCAAGGRSAQAVEYLTARGYDAVNVAGGIFAWRDAGHDVVAG